MSGPVGSSQWMYKSEDYTIDKSLRFDDGSSAHLKRTFGTATNTDIFTLSFWVKRGNLGANMIFFGQNNSPSSGDWGGVTFTSDDQFYWRDRPQGADNLNLKTTRRFRDTAAWYHFVLIYDSSESTASNRGQIWVNGVRETVFTEADYPSSSAASIWNTTGERSIGIYNTGTPEQQYDGYMAEVHFIDGTAVAASSFGLTGAYGEWKPKEYSGTYGDNGYYLDFAASGDLGDDESGEGNDFTVVNLSAIDQMVDTPTNNFCTLDPLANAIGTLAEGNLKAASTVNDKVVWSTFGITSGKWYVEVHNTVQGPESHYTGSGVWGSPMGVSDSIHNNLESYGNTVTVRSGTGVVTLGSIGAGSGTKNSNMSAATTTGDIITIAFNADNGSVWFAKNAAPNISSTAQVTGLTTSPRRDYRFAQQEANGAPGSTFTWNFGQDSSFAGQETAQGNQDGNDIGDFYYTPPTGYLALCTSNLSEPTVKPKQHFNTVLYTGDQTSNLAITGVGFQPDLIWGKNRSGDSNNWLFDSLRGTTKMLESDTEDAQETQSGVTSFDSDGFTLGNWIGSTKTNDSYVAWNWNAGTGTASGTSSGSGTGKAYDAKYNTAAGFSMIDYRGNGTDGHTIPHHLGVAPDWVVVKAYSRSGVGWMTYSSGMTLNESSPNWYGNWERSEVWSDAASNIGWSDSAPTSTVFSLGENANFNDDDEDYIAFCFKNIDGFSKTGYYTGSGSQTNGTFVYTGFRPAFVLITKVNGSGSHWLIFDNKRSSSGGGNLMQEYLYTNLSQGEDDDATRGVDFLSNGFKNRNNFTALDASGGNYVYLAFAETPFKYANAK